MRRWMLVGLPTDPSNAQHVQAAIQFNARFYDDGGNRYRTHQQAERAAAAMAPGHSGAASVDVQVALRQEVPPAEVLNANIYQEFESSLTSDLATALGWDRAAASPPEAREWQAQPEARSDAAPLPARAFTGAAAGSQPDAEESRTLDEQILDARDAHRRLLVVQLERTLPRDDATEFRDENNYRVWMRGEELHRVFGWAVDFEHDGFWCRDGLGVEFESPLHEALDSAHARTLIPQGWGDPLQLLSASRRNTERAWIARILLSGPLTYLSDSEFEQLIQAAAKDGTREYGTRLSWPGQLRSVSDP